MLLNKYKIIIALTLSIVVVMSGCTEIQQEITNFTSNIPKFFRDTSEKVKRFFDEGLSALTDDLSKAPNVIDHYIEVALKELDKYIDTIPFRFSVTKVEDINIVKAIAQLEPISDKSFATFNTYQNFADGVNTILKFINREGEVDSQILQGTTDEFEEVSKFVTRWIPLVDNYNNLIYSARAYDENNLESIKSYYVALGLFGLEIGLIYSHTWYKFSYAIVGKIYRISGLNRLAFKCPTLISSILSKAHWGVRNYLTDTTTETAGVIIMDLPHNVMDDISERISTE